MKRDARQAILDAGADLIHRQGFHNTGLADILAAAGVPKGSFYFYFKSKEELGLALVEHHAQRMAGVSASLLDQGGDPPLIRLRRLFETFRGVQAEGGCVRGCPLGNLAQEMSDLSPAMRQALQTAMAAMSSRLAGLLAQARDRGELKPGLDPERTAAFILDSWEGALLRMKVEKNPGPLLRFEEFLFDHLLA
ncbi:TetR family transcriptional regulator C-terminal domain-containing protein [Desulfovibrio aminophilus]|uniref:TetR/AcrR family transcriptional regulator n=1 Tax=Desulfovibrio aminophilus TaxID=81425 RepID=UPI003396A3DD